MRVLVTVMCLAMSGCTQLLHGQAADPPKRIDQKQKIYTVDCSGVASMISTCYEAASKQCDGKYEVLETRKSSRAIDRGIVFECK